MMIIRFLLCGLLMFGAACMASVSEAIKMEFSLSKSKSLGEFNNGELGRLAVHIDREDGQQTYANFKMENIPGGEKTVSFAKVTLLDESCTGSPIGFFEYGRLAFDQQVLPQSFAVGRQSCVLVEFYHQDIYGKVKLIDKFQVLLKK